MNFLKRLFGRLFRPRPINVHIYIDGREITDRMKVIADGVAVERNQRGVAPVTRIYK